MDTPQVKGTWREVANAARTTIGESIGYTDVASNWKRRMLLAEHSPIRKLVVNWKWYNLKSWVSVHFVRHKYGIEHFVQSQRPDRKGPNRDDAPQSTLINHECEANAQAIINISRKRLCGQAMPETKDAWDEFLSALEVVEPELVRASVPECVYRGWCYEYNSCGFHLTSHYRKWLNEYRENINHWGERSEDNNFYG